MKQNYIDGKGNYHNEQNLTLAQIYDSGVEFGCKVTAKDKAEDIIEELEKIKHEIGKEFVDLQDGSEEWRSYVNEAVLSCYEIIEKHLSELKRGTK